MLHPVLTNLYYKHEFLFQEQCCGCQVVLFQFGHLYFIFLNCFRNYDITHSSYLCMLAGK